VQDVIVLLAILAVLAATVWIVSGPLRAGRRAEESAQTARDALEAAKEAKYREIRDAEMDFRTGKLSEADYRALDRQLRAEAVEILHRIDEV
jgi:type II secretory pathway pseudopilin PulG